MNILISAYAVSPLWGSEPGMGWNWIIHIAKHCNLFIITEESRKSEILEAITKLPQKNNLHFYFVPISPKARIMCKNQGDWRFYWYYAHWQKKVLSLAKKIISENRIDIIHQLNMVGFREPGYLWKFDNIPFVWGPICGMDKLPIAYLNDGGVKNKILYRVKNLLNSLQFRFAPRVRAAMQHASIVLAATSAAKKAVETVYNKNSIFINETGSEINTCEDNYNANNEGAFNVLWVGRFIYTKRLDIALKSLALTKNKNIHLTICGSGSKIEVDRYHKLASSLGLDSRIKWMGRINHDKIAEIMSNANLFFFTSIMEATSTVILEAISYYLPILSFNTCGFGPLVKEFAGKTIELSNESKSIQEFAEQLDFLSTNPNVLKKISEEEKKQAILLSWDYKAKILFDIYKSLQQS